MQEAKDKTQLENKKPTQYNKPSPRLFYPACGFAGLVDAMAFNYITHDKAQQKPPKEEEELKRRISNSL